jgi:hypothetical protein
VRALYPQPTEFAAKLESDSEAFGLALSRAGVPSGIADPISDVFLRFDADVDLTTAAGDLFVSAGQLRSALPQLPVAMRALGQGRTLTRDAFADAYLPSLCVLQAASINRVAPAACD